MKSERILRFVGASALFFIAGCGSVLDFASLESPVSLTIRPRSKRVALGESLLIQGSQTVRMANSVTVNSERENFDWAIEEGSIAGSLTPAPASTIAYQYTAPPSPGVYHVVISSRRHPSLTARAEITVTP